MRRPVRPDTPRLLPSVASCWPQLVAALRDTRTPAVERALALLAEAVRLAGGHFMSSRFQQQALPLLQQLLERGSAAIAKPIGLSGHQSRSGGATPLLLDGGAGVMSGGAGRQHLAPAAVQRVRVAALECLAAVCTQREGRGGQQAMAAATGIQHLAWEIAACSAPFLGQSHVAPLRAAAATAVMGAARLDPDAVWMLMYDVVAGASGSIKVCTTGGELGGVGGAAGRPSGASAATAAGGVDSGAQLQLLTWRPIRVSGVGGSGGSGKGSWPVTAPMCVDCLPMASQLLPAVEALTPAWHALAPVVGPDWQVPADQSVGA